MADDAAPTPDDPIHHVDPFDLESTAPTSSPDSNGRGRGIAVVVIAALVVLVGSTTVFSRERNTGVLEAERTPTVAPIPTPTATPVPTPTPDAAEQLATRRNAFDDRRARDTALAQLANVDPSMAVVYESADGPVVIRFDGLGATIPAIGPPPSLATDPVLVTTIAGSTVAIDRSDPTRAGVIATVGEVVRNVDGTYTFINPVGDDDVATFVVVDPVDATSNSLEVPASYVRDIWPGLGLIVRQSEQDAHFLVTEGGFEQWRAAGFVETMHDDAELAYSCRDECRREFRRIEEPVGRAVPDQFSLMEGLLAPDASAVLFTTSETGYGEIWFPDNGGIAWVNGSGMFAPAWSPDSAFVAWLDIDDGPKLKVMQVERRDWIVVDLDVIGAPAPATPTLQVFRLSGFDQSD